MELEGQHDEDQNHRHNHDDEQALKGLLLAKIVAAQLPTVPGRQRNVGHPAANVGDHGAETRLLFLVLGGHEDGRLLVFPVLLIGSANGGNAGHCRQRHQAIAIGRRGRGTCRRRGRCIK